MNLCFRHVVYTISIFILSSTININGILPFFAPLTSDNFHTIEPEKAYRSRQLSAAKLARYITKYQIKTVINLRGIEKNTQWWNDEHAAIHRYKLHFVNISLLANRFPSSQQLRELIETFKVAPRPVLIHCRHGRDRTGLAAGLWVFEEMKKNKEAALGQLSYAPFGHMQWLFPAMKDCLCAWIDLRAKHADLNTALAAYHPHRYGYEQS